MLFGPEENLSPTEFVLNTRVTEAVAGIQESLMLPKACRSVS